MAEVTLSIGGFSYQIACRDGEEAHLAKLAAVVDAKAGEARSAVGNISEVRQLLLAALLLADEADVANVPPSPAGDAGISPLLEAVADRVEALADRVEKLASQP